MLHFMRSLLQGVAGGPTVTLASNTYEDTTVSPADAVASFTIGNNRVVGGTGPVYDWLSIDGTPSEYEAVVTVTSGSLTSGAAGTFNLGTTQTWSRNRTLNSAGTTTAVINVSIRRVDTPGVILASGNMTLSATVTA